MDSDHPMLAEDERTRCEVWTRVMGYLRPVSCFNEGKQAEYRDRKWFRLNEKEFRLREQEVLPFDDDGVVP